jgi:hypothetical protein
MLSMNFERNDDDSIYTQNYLGTAHLLILNTPATGSINEYALTRIFLLNQHISKKRNDSRSVASAPPHNLVETLRLISAFRNEIFSKCALVCS